MNGTHLLIIDPQNDFCDRKGALSVPNADGDMKRLAHFVDRFGDQIDQIHVTLDSHGELDIAHGLFWVDAHGVSPAPFTIISQEDFDEGVWRPRKPEWHDRAGQYLRQLSERGRYDLTIWPPHCIVGSWGHGIFPVLSDSLRDWQRRNLRQVNTIHKGGNMWTEHYSAVKAEVVDPDDPHTQINQPLLDTLGDSGARRVLVAGEALSHCVANTVRDLGAAMPDGDLHKFVLLRDCTSSVAGLDSLGHDFLQEITPKGMTLAESTEAPHWI